MEYRKFNNTIVARRDKGNPRYYIIALGDYDKVSHCWYYNASSYDKDGDGKKDYMYDYKNDTKADFGAGIGNTKNMITAWNEKKYGEQNGNINHTDIWEINKTGWFVPSIAEWSAFASYLNTSKTKADPNYYINYGLSTWYWSSTQLNAGAIYEMSFGLGTILKYSAQTSSVYLRLASTF